MKTIYSRNCFLDTETNIVRDGFAYRVNFPQEPFSIQPGQKMKLTLTSYDQRRNWYSINQTNNKFFFAVKDERNVPNAIKFYEVLIPPGSYQSFMELCLAIQSGLNTALDNAGALVVEGVYAANTTAKVGYEDGEPDGSTVPPTQIPSTVINANAFATGNRKLTIEISNTPQANFTVDLCSFQVKDASKQTSFLGTDPESYFQDTHEILGGAPTRTGTANQATNGIAGQSSNGTLLIDQAGTNYTVATNIALGNSGALGEIVSINGSGAITDFKIIAAGSGFKIGEIIKIPGGHNDARIKVERFAYATTPYITMMDFGNALTNLPAQSWISYYPASLNSMECLYVRTSILNSNYQTFGYERWLPDQNGLVATDILARIPLTDAYFDDQKEFLVYDDQNNNYFVLLERASLDSIEFRITDDKGRPISETGDDQSRVGQMPFKMVLRWDVLVDEEQEMLQEMRQQDFRPSKKAEPYQMPMIAPRP